MNSTSAHPVDHGTGLKNGRDQTGAPAIQRWRAACSSHRVMGEPASTIREFLPWHVIEKKMAARAEARAHDDAVPDSGVYASGESPAAVMAANQNAVPLTPGESIAPATSGVAPIDSGGLSYQVYTLKDLEARGINADLSVPSTRMSVVMNVPRPNPWGDVARAAFNIVRLSKTWIITPSPKPTIKDAFRAPVVALGYELRQAFKATDWKKVGIYAGFSVGVFLFLLFAVLTAADLTDDLKPSRVSNTQTGDSYTNAIVAAAHPTAAPVAKAAAPAPAPTDTIEVSSEPTPPPAAHAAKTPAKKKGAGKKKAPKSGEVFTP